MRVLVLGGNGFIGSHVVDHLLAAGWKVRVFDRAREHFRAPLAGVDYRLAPFDDVPALAEALEGVDVVCHLISTTVPSTSNLDPVSDVEGNLINTVRLLQLMVQKKVPRVVYLSSGGTVYGCPQSLPIPESHPLRPICSYGVVKVAIENYLHMFHHLHGLQYCILRASNPYGERQGHGGVQGVISTFSERIFAGEAIEVWGDGSVIRDFIYVGDLALLGTKACASGCYGTFNVGSGSGCSVREIIEMLETVANRRADVNYRDHRSYDVPEVVLDISAAKTTFAWSPAVDLECGIQRSWAWLTKEVKKA